MAEWTDPERLNDYKPYLLALAKSQLNPRLQTKMGASDVVQQSLLQACQAIGEFRGSSEAELRGWLRQILARNIIHVHRDLHRDKRNIDREHSMEDQLGKSSLRLENLLSSEGPSPSHYAMVGEQLIRLSTAL